MRRISYWVLSTVSAAVLLFAFDASQRGGATAGTRAAISGGTAGTTGTTGQAGPTAGSSPSTGSGQPSSTPSTGTGRTGRSPGSSPSSSPTQAAAATVNGQVAQTQWGPVQVQLTVSDRTITKVAILQYPHDNPRDVELANYSLPILIQETLKNQSAQIDMVSGATYTSQGYLQSLQSALDQAHL